MENRKIQEKKFHDRLREVAGDDHVMSTRWNLQLESTIRDNELWKNMKYYAVERKSREMVLAWIKKNCPGKRVLDYCCGNGEDGRIIAKSGAKEIVGIDISEISIKNCETLAAKEGLQDTMRYMVMDAENTNFEDNSFDIISEYGALHHVDLDKAFGELVRILRPDGKVICNEALAHNPVIHLYRKMTPHLRTKWEVQHILRKKDIELARKYFGKVEIYFFHLFTLLAVPFRRYSIFSPILSFLERVDQVTLVIPGIRWWAWQAIFIFSEPIKKRT